MLSKARALSLLMMSESTYTFLQRPEDLLNANSLKNSEIKTIYLVGYHVKDQVVHL